MEKLVIVLFIALIFRPLRRLLMRNATALICAIVLFFVGFHVGGWFCDLGAPDLVRWLGGAVFVIEGVPEVMKYLADISGSGHRQ